MDQVTFSVEKLFFVCVYPQSSDLKTVKVVDLDEESKVHFYKCPVSFITKYAIEFANNGYKVISVYRGFEL